jgi:hygromycin-B 7''-O-kinase
MPSLSSAMRSRTAVQVAAHRPGRAGINQLRNSADCSKLRENIASPTPHSCGGSTAARVELSSRVSPRLPERTSELLTASWRCATFESFPHHGVLWFSEYVRSAAPAELAFASTAEYAATLGEVQFWEPYVHAALRRHALPTVAPGVGTGGTFPTFLAGSYVVKLFPALFSGGACFEIERSIHQLFLEHRRILAPPLVAHGHLFDTEWRWPYVITRRLAGASWRSADLSTEDQEAVAVQLGALMRQVHELACPAEAVWSNDVLSDLRATCADRHRTWNILPSRLVDQIESFVSLSPPSTAQRLVHADLHSDHIFVDAGRLVGVIDWGDALYGDPYYELPALYFGTFGGNKCLLRAFLDGYNWDLTRDFATRAMTMTLVHEFCPLAGRTPPLDGVASLEQLASLLWDYQRS